MNNHDESVGRFAPRSPLRHRCLAWCALAFASAAHTAPPSTRDLADLSLEELSNIQVTSVSRRAESLADAAASIYVITSEDIRRSGVTSLPDALRLAPNLQVARLNNRRYAITARGFNTTSANKLLVLIDGRTVYSPLFSGVFWDVQNVVLEDIERIEVIDGPGAATWGLNAVSGVINVITRSAAETQGLLVSAGAGDQELAGTLRYGGSFEEDGHFRVYAKGSRLEDTELASGTTAFDGWERAQMGFRADWSGIGDRFTLQGDAYDASSDERPTRGPLEISGANLLGRWKRDADERSSIELLAYYDRSERTDPLMLEETTEIAEIDLKHAFDSGAHRLVWGGGYRHARDNSRTGAQFAFIPARRKLSWYNVFLQDQIRLGGELDLTLGARLEHNDYTGWEALPNLRLAWKPDAERLVWGALSRAVRAPARLDREFFVPGQAPFLIQGGPDFASEVADVMELGYRARPSISTSFSITAFEHRYDKLRSVQLAPGVGTFIANMIEGEVSGLTAWGSWQATPGWRLSGGGILLDTDLRLKPGATVSFGTAHHGNDPDYQLMLRSSFDIAEHYELDLMVRYVDELPQPRVPSYAALDLRLGWRPAAQWELSLTVRDLLQSSHAEFSTVPQRSEFEPAAFLKVLWQR